MKMEGFAETSERLFKVCFFYKKVNSSKNVQKLEEGESRRRPRIYYFDF